MSLFGRSRDRKERLLALFEASPHHQFLPSELAKATGLRPGSFHAELAALEQDGRIVSDWAPPEGARPRRRYWLAPRPPENIRLVYPDGREIPVECRYTGIQDGVHVWEAITPAGVQVVPGLQVHVDLMPPRTAVFLPVAEDE